MTDFEKLMELLQVPQDKREELFEELVRRNLTLSILFKWDGSIEWGTL